MIYKEIDFLIKSRQTEGSWCLEEVEIVIGDQKIMTMYRSEYRDRSVSGIGYGLTPKAARNRAWCEYILNLERAGLWAG
jgi:hypothetical protein